jgi:ABC-type Fe3+-hydroxamate transport system substrate-binding protein
MVSITDSTNKILNFNSIPHRVVCLIPSITETLFDLGLGHLVAGVSKFCIHPSKEVQSKTKVGGQKDPDLEKITALDPDLVFLNQEENKPEHIETLSSKFPTWITYPKTFEDAAALIDDIALVFDVKEKAESYVKTIRHAVDNGSLHSQRKIKTLYLIWRNPWMTINGDTFIHNAMELYGLENVFAGRNERYFAITVDEIKSADPELIVLPDEPYKFKEKHKADFSDIPVKAVENKNILLADGTYFCWYGTRTARAPEYFKRKILSRIKFN